METPEPITKLTWDNAALLSPATAARLGVQNMDVVRIESGERSLDAAVWIAPGHADDTLTLALGWGRTNCGRVGRGFGANAYALRTSDAPHFVGGIQVTTTGGTYNLACTQPGGSKRTKRGSSSPEFLQELVDERLKGAVPARSATLAKYQEEAHFVDAYEVMAKEHIHSLWKNEPNETDGNQWGMAIDLNTCTGCSACIVACTAENNVSVVGKEQVFRGREMHWLRLDRYYREEGGSTTAALQPLGCAHCETAPCENVCPVGATTHSPEGLNDMAYNRCIGTRYCANNCPYKVRRYNFFNFSRRNEETTPLVTMARNPDVTVRFRGVIEKCSYCVQRIQQGKIEARLSGDGTIADGAITPACVQTCPTQAIVFGNLNDETSQVAKARANERNYAILAELNIRPRTTYLAKIHNTNPVLAPHVAEHATEQHDDSNPAHH